MTRTQKIAAAPLAALLLLGGGAIAGYASLADAQTPTPGQGTRPERPAVVGTVASVSGSTLTITGKDGTTYTVNASGATVLTHKEGTQGPQTGSLSDIAVGDTVGVRGTVSGTSVTATELMKGMPFGKGIPGGMHGGKGVHGTISAINGNSLTITNTDGTSYTVDASGATVSKTIDISLSDLKVGDTVGVMGSASGTSISAKHIMSGKLPTPQAPPAQR